MPETIKVKGRIGMKLADYNELISYIMSLFNCGFQENKYKETIKLFDSLFGKRF